MESQTEQTPSQKFLHNFVGAMPRGLKQDGKGFVKAFKLTEVECNPRTKEPVSLTGTITYKDDKGADVVSNVRWNVQGGCYAINDAPAANPLFDLVEKVSV